MSQHSPPLVAYFIIGALVLVSIWIRGRRLTRRQELRLQWMWAVPTLVIAYGAYTLWQFPPQGATWLWLLLAAVAGAGFGWVRGKLMAITIDPTTGSLMVQGSRVTVYLVAGLVVLRYGLRALMADGQVHVMPLSQANDALICFTVALLTVQRVEMAIRAIRLKAASPPKAPPAA